MTPGKIDLTAAWSRDRAGCVRRARPVLFIVVLGLVVGGLALSIIGRLDWRKLETEFNRVAEERNAAVARTLEQHLNVLAAIGAFYDATGEVDRDQFRRFVTPLLRRNPGIQALEWIPRVSGAEREAWAQSVRDEGFEGFRITERTHSGETVAAARRDEYLPVAYVEPLAGNEAAFGFDVGSSPERMRAITMAAKTGRLAATGPVTLVREKGDRSGVLVFMPRYRQFVGAPIAREDAMTGLVLGVFRIGDVLATAIDDRPPGGVDIEIADMTVPHKPVTIARHWSRTRGPDESPGSIAAIPSAMTRELTIDMAGRTWRLVSTPAPALLRSHRSLLPLWIGADGVLVTGLIAGCALLLVGRTIRVEQLIAEHTRKLTQVNKRHEQTNIELEHRNEEILRLCYAMTHDLQTPLASLAGGVDALEHRLDDPTPDQTRWMDRIRASAQRMVAMLDDLMVYARMGTEELETKPVDLRERIGAVMEELQPQAERQGVRIALPDVENTAYVVLGDGRIMVRVLMNLVGNAVKYIGADEHGVVELSLCERDEFVRLTVKDNGPGIDPSLLDEVFQPFRRASAGTEGTGLGLSLVRRYVTAMGGRVWLESDGENGTTAVVEMPLAAREAEKERKAA